MRAHWIPGFVLLAFAASLARAEEPDPVALAKQYFEAGKQAHETGQYVVAIAAFEEAYRLSPRASVRFSLGQAYRRQFFVDHDHAKLERAVTLYRQYVEETPEGGRRNEAVGYLAELEPVLARVQEEHRAAGGAPEPPPAAPPPTQLMVSSRTPGARASIDGGALAEIPVTQTVTPGRHEIRVEAPGFMPDELDGDAVEGRLIVVPVQLREQPAHLTVRAPSGATVEIDGRRAGVAPLAKALELPSGRHFLAVTQRGRKPWARELELGRAQEVSVEAELSPTRQRYVSYWVLGGAGAILVAGGVTTVLAFAAQDDASELWARRQAGNITLDDLDAYDAAIDRRDTMRLASGVLYGSTVAVAAIGGLLYYLDHPEVESPGDAVLTPTATDDSLGVSLSGRF